MRNVSGNTSMWIGSNTEIHEQKKMAETLRPREEALRESEAYLRDAFGNQPFDIELYGQLCDRLGRYLQRFGLKRVARDTQNLRQCLATPAKPPVERCQFVLLSQGHRRPQC